MSWVQSIVLFYSYLAWVLYGVGLVVAAFECGIEYQSGRGSIIDTALNAFKSFMTVGLFTVVPVELYIDGFISWSKQVIHLCLTAVLQARELITGLMVVNNHALLELGLMLAAGEIAHIEKALKEQRFSVKRAEKEDIKRILAVCLSRTS